MRRTIFDESHELFRQTVRGLIEQEVSPHFEEWERRGIVDRRLYRTAGALGLMGLPIDEAFGGGGTSDFRFEAIIQEEFAGSGMLNAGLGIINHNVALSYLTYLASQDQRGRWMPGLARGDLLATVAMTEPGAGSDLGAIKTHAVRDGDHYVVSGAKTFISSGQLGDLVIVVCRTGQPADAHAGLSLIVVEGSAAGFHRGRNLHKVGQHAADTSELFFDDVAVPVANLLGEENRGFFHLVANLPGERLGIAVVALAHAQAAFDWTLRYAKERFAFGQPIGSFQNSRFVLATMRTELDVGQVFIDRLIDAHIAGILSSEEAAEAKWWCADLNRRVLDGCLQLHGGYGYMEEYPIARAWRDGRVFSIFGGTNEIMKDLIGRRMLGV